MLTLNAEGKTGSDAVDFVKDSLSANNDERELKIIIDRPDQSEGITKYLTSEGFNVLLEDDDGTMFLLASKTAQDDNDSDSDSDSESEIDSEPEPESESDIKIQDFLTPIEVKDDTKTASQVKPKVINNTVIKDSSAVILSYENKKYMPAFTEKIIDSLNKSKIKPDVIVPKDSLC